MKTKLIALKNSTTSFAHKHKTALTVVATATPLIAIHMRSTKIVNEFLEEHGLLDEFYQMDEV